MSDADPFDATSASRMGKRIERVADQSKNVLDANLLKHANEDIRNCMGHLRLRFL
jgi:hypothetical protein